MGVFLKAEGKFSEIAKKYMGARETAKVSKPLLYNGKTYREIAFFKSGLFGKTDTKVIGAVFVTEDGVVVTDTRDKRELSVLAYNLELLFDEPFLNNLSKAIVPDSRLKMEDAEAAYFEANLDLLASQDVNGAAAVKNIVSKLPELKRENNQALKNYIDKARELEKSDMVFSSDMMNEIKALYTETLMRNFDKVKLIGKGRNYYGDLKKEILSGYKRKMFGIMGSTMTGSATKAEYEINYLTKVVEVYDEIIEMSESEYIKYLQDMEKRNINEKIEMLRV